MKADPLMQIARNAIDSLRFAEDAISLAKIDLEKQAIHLQTTNSHGFSRINAEQLAEEIIGETDNNRSFFIKAEAGSGKTWMMQQLALALCKRFVEGRSQCLPFIIPVQSLVGGLTQETVEDIAKDAIEKAPERMVNRFLQTGNSILGLKSDEATRASLSKACQDRRLILLVDGVDEASSCSKAIEIFTRKCARAKIRLVVTSRPEGISADPLKGKIICESAGSYNIAFDNSEIIKGVKRVHIRNLSGDRKGRVTSITDNEDYSILYDTKLSHNGMEEEGIGKDRILWPKYNVTAGSNVKHEVERRTGRVSIDGSQNTFTVTFIDKSEVKGIFEGGAAIFDDKSLSTDDVANVTDGAEITVKDTQKGCVRNNQHC
jgi:hypothetical protein